MTNDTSYIHDALTNEVIIVELTDEEQKKLDADRALAVQLKQENKNKEAQLREIKIAAYEKLGLTPEEIEAILPAVEKDAQTL